MRIKPEELKRVLEYNPVTGEFFWLISGSAMRVGDLAGSVYSNGYRYIQINNEDYRAGRLAWFYVTGEDPLDFIDHKDGIRDNNRFRNLRKATNSQNQANRGAPFNNTSGFKGVTWQASRMKWLVRITVNNHSKNLGRYVNLVDAVKAYRVAALAAWGEYAKVPTDEEIEKTIKRMYEPQIQVPQESE